MPNELLKRNREWAARQEADLFDDLTDGQSPRFLWISCSDSRVPANEIVDCHPGDLFVHRNIANRIDHDDLNGLSVLQYAVEVLQVPHIVVCGHYRCGGVKAAMETTDHGLIDNWLRPIKDCYHRCHSELDALADEQARWDRLCELNVVDQVEGIARTTVVQKAWQRGQNLTIHGWIYHLSGGLIQNLGVEINSPEQVPAIYRIAPSQNEPAREPSASR
ncbi:MAG: carbonic anhydrase [Longimonas sp.]|uniref:carbonic anhydrase n=1 Tax=Longimonas sp. TaxID=2039626 RepID=UPI0033594E19